MDKNGNLLSKKKDVQDRSTEHFKVLNRETPVNPTTITDEVGFDLVVEIQVMAANEPTLGEVKEAVKKLKSWKAPGRKIPGRIVIDRVRNGVDKRLRKEQAGYMEGEEQQTKYLY